MTRALPFLLSLLLLLPRGGPAFGQEAAGFRVVNRTDAAVPFTLAVDGQALACTVPARGIQTYLGSAP